MSCYTREQVESTVKSKGYKWFEDINNKGYDVNIVGIRNSKTKGRVTNAFDDCITLSYKIDGEWQFHCFPCKTDPGSHWVKNILSEQGMNEFNKHEDMIKNPVKAFNDVVKMGINEKGPNLYLKGDIDVGAAIEKLMQSPDIKELIGVGVPQTKEEYLRLNPDKNFQDYQAYLKGHQVGVSNVIKETLNTIVIGLRKTGQ